MPACAARCAVLAPPSTREGTVFRTYLSWRKRPVSPLVSAAAISCFGGALLEHGARWQARHGFEDNACGALAWGSINTPEPGGDWAGCAQALLDHGLPPAAPDPSGSDAVWLDGRLMHFSDEVTDCLLAAAELPVQSAQPVQ